MKTTTPKKTTSTAKTPAKMETPVTAKAPASPKAPAKAKPAAKTQAAPAAVKAAEPAPVKKAVKKAVKAVPAGNSVTFTYRAEKGCSVFLAGSFNKWNGTAEKMIDKNGNGVYTAELTLAPGSYEYKFVIDGSWCADPECADWVQNSHGTLNSVKHVGV